MRQYLGALDVTFFNVACAYKKFFEVDSNVITVTTLYIIYNMRFNWCQFCFAYATAVVGSKYNSFFYGFSNIVDFE